MLFRCLPKEGFRDLVEMTLETIEVVGPKEIGRDKDDNPIHHYLPVSNPDEIDFDYATTEYSVKTYFLPFQENLSTYRFDEDDWIQDIRYRIQPRAIIGLHACDINGLLKLDRSSPAISSQARITSRGDRIPSSSVSTTSPAMAASADLWEPTR